MALSNRLEAYIEGETSWSMQTPFFLSNYAYYWCHPSHQDSTFFSLSMWTHTGTQEVPRPSAMDSGCITDTNATPPRLFWDFQLLGLSSHWIVWHSSMHTTSDHGSQINKSLFIIIYTPLVLFLEPWLIILCVQNKNQKDIYQNTNGLVTLW
jgi:hypothetical protein